MKIKQDIRIIKGRTRCADTQIGILKKELIKDWLNFSVIDIIENDNVIDKSSNLIKIGLDLYDSLHIACAIEAKAEYFVTTDSKILNKKNLIGEIRTINPIDFIKVYTGE